MLKKRFNGRFNGRKNAMLTTEMSLGIAIVVVVIFVAMSIFGGNLKDMIANGGMHNKFNKQNDISSQYDNQSVDYTKSQIEVQITGSQGSKTLEQYVSDAQAIVDSFTKNPPANPSEDELDKLAKALTILSVKSSTINSPDLCTKYNITINLVTLTNKKMGETIVGTKIVPYPSPTTLDNDADTLKAIQTISQNFS